MTKWEREKIPNDRPRVRFYSDRSFRSNHRSVFPPAHFFSYIFSFPVSEIWSPLKDISDIGAALPNDASDRFRKNLKIITCTFYFIFNNSKSIWLGEKERRKTISPGLTSRTLVELIMVPSDVVVLSRDNSVVCVLCVSVVVWVLNSPVTDRSFFPFAFFPFLSQALSG